MIYLDMEGYGYGNQLFQYAAARRLQTMMPQQRICINLSKLSRYPQERLWLKDVYARIDHTEEHTKSSVRYHGTLRQKLVSRAFRMYRRSIRDPQKLYNAEARMAPLLNRFGLYQLSHTFAEPAVSRTQNLFLDGVFECWQMCMPIRSILLEEIRLREPARPKNQAVIEQMRSKESVMLHVRRGDFLGGKRDICTPQYYQTAVSYIKKSVPNCTFFVFSNDIPWVKQNLELGGGTVYEDSLEVCSPPELLQIMSSCKHFIIANSTFSWWAQFLGRDENKIVIAPQYGEGSWSRLGYSSTSIMPGWVLYDVKTDRWAEDAGG